MDNKRFHGVNVSKNENENYVAEKKFEYGVPKSGVDNPAFESANCNAADKNAASTEEEDYDPYEFGKARHATSYLETVFHIVIISAGPPLLSLPNTFLNVGYIPGAIVTFLLVLLYAYAMSLIISSEYEICKLKRIPNLPYPEVMFSAFKEGPARAATYASLARWLSYVIFIVIWFGYCCYDYVMICQNLQLVYNRRFHKEITTTTLLAIMFVPLLLLCFIRKLKQLAPLSILGTVFNATSLILVVYYCFADPAPWKMLETFDSVSSIPLLAGTVLFNLNATGIMISLKNEMKHPKKFNSGLSVLALTFSQLSIVYTLFSLVCCLKYGNLTKESVIQNLPADELLPQIGILASSLSLVFQFPLVMYVPFEVIWHNILKAPETIKNYRIVWEYLLRTALVGLSFVISFAVPNVFLFLSISGTVGTSIDSLIFPALANTFIMLRICDSKVKLTWTVMKNSVIIVLALILVVTGLKDSVDQIYASKGG